MTSPERAPLHLVKAANLTDLGNADRVIAQYGSVLRFNTDAGQWLVSVNNRWVPDESREVERLACATARSIWKEIPGAGDTQEKSDLAAHARRSESERSIRAMLTLAQSNSAVVVRASQLDANPWLLGVRNGVIDLRTGEHRTYQPDDLITKCAAVDFDPNARAPQWESFLERVLPSADVRAYCRRGVGYSLTGRTTEQNLFMPYGLGSNGKGVFTRTIYTLLGDYSTLMDSTTLIQRRMETGGPRPDLARLQAKRFVKAEEFGENGRLDEALIKKLTGDLIVARELYAKDQEFEPHFKLWVSTNHKPIVRGTDHAIWRRLHIIPFTVTIPELERDPFLEDRLRQEELPGILNWALEGCAEWREYGLIPPKEVRLAIEEYRAESDIIGAFVDEQCDLDQSALTPAKALFEAYKSWADAAGEPRMSLSMFGRKLGERGYEKVKSGSVHRKGLRLKVAGHSGHFEPDFTDSSRVRAGRKVPDFGAELSQLSESVPF